MRQLELTHFRSPSRRKKALAAPPPEEVLTDEVMHEVVRLMASGTCLTPVGQFNVRPVRRPCRAATPPRQTKSVASTPPIFTAARLLA